MSYVLTVSYVKTGYCTVPGSLQGEGEWQGVPVWMSSVKLDTNQIRESISHPERGLRKGWFYCLLDMGHHTICMLDKTFGSVFQGVFALKTFVNQK